MSIHISWYSIACAIVALHQVSGLFPWVYILVFYCVCHCGATSGIGTFSMSLYLGILLRVRLMRYIRYRDFFHESISWYSIACAIDALHQVSGLFPWVYILVFYCVCHWCATSGIGTFSYKEINPHNSLGYYISIHLGYWITCIKFWITILCCMLAGNAYPSGHLVPSPFMGLAYAPIVVTRFFTWLFT